MCVKLLGNRIIVQLHDETCDVNFHGANADYIEPVNAEFDITGIVNVDKKYAFQCQNEEYQKDFWSDEIITLPAHEKVSLSLESHCSCLFSVSENRGLKVLDSNVQLNNLSFSNGVLTMDVPYDLQPELSLNFRPDKVLVNDKLLPVECVIIADC